MKEWFTIDKAVDDTWIISEYRHWEETHCYLLCGSERSLLIDTGLGICNVSEVVGRLHHGSGTFDYGDWAVWL